MPTPEEIRQMEHKHIKLSYNRIDDQLYAGNNMCCQTHFEMELLSKGITADISLEAERLDNPQGVDYFFWFPWVEDTAPTIGLVNLALNVIDDLIKSNVTSYVHCKNGHGRTSTLLACYLMRKSALSPEKALEALRERRPSMHINETQRAFLKEFSQITSN